MKFLAMIYILILVVGIAPIPFILLLLFCQMKTLHKKIGTKKLVFILSTLFAAICLLLTIKIAITLFVCLIILAAIFIRVKKDDNIVVLFALFLYLLFVVFPALGLLLDSSTVSVGARRNSCASNLKQLGTCLFMYAGDYGGHFPDKDGDAGFEILIKYNYLSDYVVYKCPSSNDDYQDSGSLKSSYIYHSGLTTAAPAGTVLVEDNPGNHEKYINYLYCDMSVKGVSDRKFQPKRHNYSKNLIIIRLINWFRK